ncbi:MAG: HipA domain-containing protein [Clostridium butyricum]
MSLTQSEILYIKTIMKSKNPSDNEAIEFYNKHKELFINMDSSDIKYIENSRTERGALPKWNVQRDGEVYFVKTGNYSYGTFSTLEPVSEYIASAIGYTLNINICNSFIEEIDVFHKKVLVSMSKSFLSNDNIYRSIRMFLSDSEIKSNELLDLIIEKFPQYKEDIYNMIIFDFLINNTDRHLNNFGFICSDEGEIISMAPLFDNGMSLLADVNEDILRKDINLLDRNSSCKPFRSRQHKQIKLVPKEFIRYIDHLSNIEELVMKIEYLSDLRKECIINLLRLRNNYLKERCI